MCSLDNRRCFCHRIAIASGTSEMVSLGWVWGFWIMTLQYPSPSLCGGGRVPCSRFLSLLCLYILDGSWWRFSVRSWSWPFWGIGHGRRELVLDTRFFAWFYYSTRIETSTCRSFLILYFFAGLQAMFCLRRSSGKGYPKHTILGAEKICGIWHLWKTRFWNINLSPSTKLFLKVS